MEDPKTKSALETFCACKRRLAELEREKSNKCHPYLKHEKECKAHLLALMNQGNVRSVELEPGKKYLVRTSTRSTRVITDRRVAEAMQKAYDECRANTATAAADRMGKTRGRPPGGSKATSATPAWLDASGNIDESAVVRSIYSALQSICVTNSPCVKFANAPLPSASSAEDGRGGAHSKCIPGSDLHNRLCEGARKMERSQIALEEVRDHYAPRKSKLKTQKDEVEAQVLSYLDSQPGNGRKVRLTTPEGARINCQLQSRERNSTGDHAKLGLRDFQKMLRVSVSEAVAALRKREGGRPPNESDIHEAVTKTLAMQLARHRHSCRTAAQQRVNRHVYLRPLRNTAQKSKR